MNYKLGWIPDLPDHRDSSVDTFSLHSVKSKANTSKDLRPTFSPVEDQGRLGSCTAQAGVALVEFMERRYSGRHVEGSRLFLYKNTRNLMGMSGDTGAYLRDTMKALRLFGVSDERYCPYDVSKFDEQPSAFNYALASNYKALKYFRVDMPTFTPEKILSQIKIKLHHDIPLMFGTTVYQGIMNRDGDIPFPSGNERPIGGHAMVIAGYDDNHICKGTSTPGAFLVRNSWGTSWGDGGYGWLPYEYLLQGLMCDIWGITKQDWVDTSVFD
jgi:C1A family cysteine protease